MPRNNFIIKVHVLFGHIFSNNLNFDRKKGGGIPCSFRNSGDFHLLKDKFKVLVSLDGHEISDFLFY